MAITVTIEGYKGETAEAVRNIVKGLLRNNHFEIPEASVNISLIPAEKQKIRFHGFPDDPDRREVLVQEIQAILLDCEITFE